jgi:hypothetical protein
MLGTRVREALTKSLVTKAGAVLASSGLKQLREQMNPSNANGGVLLGLGGVSVKSHGGTDAQGFATACRLAADLATSHYPEEVAANLARIQKKGRRPAECRPPQEGIKMARRSFIRGTGGYLPEKVLTNDDLSAMVDTSDEWIQERTGIKRRHVAAEGELTSDIATAAARSALEAAGVPVSDVDLIVLATTTPDQTFPATATAVQAKLGMTGGAAFDVQAVCSGFLFALATADSMLRQGLFNTAHCHRRGNLHAHPRLVGPGHLCPVRRWRRRGCTSGRRMDRRRPGWRDHAPHPHRRHQVRPALCRWRCQLHRHDRPCAHGRKPRVPARRDQYLVRHSGHL